MRTLPVILLGIVIGLALVGCSRTEAPAQAKAVRVTATKAFETYFGPAPVTEKGTCFGFVIYFPVAKDPGKVTPFPFFTFDEASLKKVALERMISGMDEKSYAGDFLQPFPKGSRLLSLSEQKGVVVADYSPELRPVATDPDVGKALYNAVVMTLFQFPGVSEVRLTSGGSELYPATARPPAEASAVAPPASPRLLNVIAMKESSAAPVNEVDALFDRPVEIKEFQFLANDGTVLAGDVFHSMFDMAAVLKPKDPKKLAGMATIRVRYRVIDKLGRSASGESSFPFTVRLHQEEK